MIKRSKHKPIPKPRRFCYECMNCMMCGDVTSKLVVSCKMDHVVCEKCSENLQIDCCDSNGDLRDTICVECIRHTKKRKRKNEIFLLERELKNVIEKNPRLQKLIMLHNKIEESTIKKVKRVKDKTQEDETEEKELSK